MPKRTDIESILIIGAGPVLANALDAADELESGGIMVNVLNSHTIKPLDTETILREAQKVKLVVTIEEHQAAGGLGSAVAEFLSQNHPVKMKIIGVNDRFGQSGNPDELYKEYGLDTASIADLIKHAL